MQAIPDRLGNIKRVSNEVEFKGEGEGELKINAKN